MGLAQAFISCPVERLVIEGRCCLCGCELKPLDSWGLLIIGCHSPIDPSRSTHQALAQKLRQPPKVSRITSSDWSHHITQGHVQQSGRHLESFDTRIAYSRDLLLARVWFSQMCARTVCPSLSADAECLHLNANLNVFSAGVGNAEIFSRDPAVARPLRPACSNLPLYQLGRLPEALSPARSHTYCQSLNTIQLQMHPLTPC